MPGTRDLRVATGANVGGIAVVTVEGQRATGDVSVAPPCACAPEQVLDIPGLVRAAEEDNDNASIGLQTNDFATVVGSAELTLSGGRYQLRELGGVGALRLNVTANSSLFVSEDLVATGRFRVDLAPEAELDIFVGGDLRVIGAARFGDPERPSATRIYVGGSGDISVAGAAAFVGNLYAPAADILVGGYGRVLGSLFGKNITALGFLDVGYDDRIVAVPEGCEPVAREDLPTLR